MKCLKSQIAVFILFAFLLVVGGAIASCGSMEEGTADRYLDQGDKFYKEGKYDQAIAAFTRSIGLDPNMASAYANRGDCYYRNGQYDLAITNYTKAIELDSDMALAYYNRSIAYYHKGQNNLALADFTKVTQISQDPTLLNEAKKYIKELSK